MRGRILEILRAGGQEPVSGEELSRQLDVSRTAVWKIGRASCRERV